VLIIRLTGFSGGHGSVNNRPPRLVRPNVVRPDSRIIAPAIESE
jgi:hypothetical protein